MFKEFKIESVSTTRIIDDDFEITMINKQLSIWWHIVTEYSNKNLDAGKNLALATIWWSKQKHSNPAISIGKMVAIQNGLCLKIPNWHKIKKSRDFFLKKFILLA